MQGPQRWGNSQSHLAKHFMGYAKGLGLWNNDKVQRNCEEKSNNLSVYRHHCKHDKDCIWARQKESESKGTG